MANILFIRYIYVYFGITGICINIWTFENRAKHLYFRGFIRGRMPLYPWTGDGRLHGAAAPGVLWQFLLLYTFWARVHFFHPLLLHFQRTLLNNQKNNHKSMLVLYRGQFRGREGPSPHQARGGEGLAKSGPEINGFFGVDHTAAVLLFNMCRKFQPQMLSQSSPFLSGRLVVQFGSGPG